MTVALTDEQQHAVIRRAESLLLSAAAGSGKTSVLVERFVAAVREDEIAPARILAITFTERAAGELRARVRARLLELGDREAARDTEAAFVGTFHGFCARLLRAHPLAVGLDPGFAILDEGLAGRLRELAFKHALQGFLAGGRRDAVDLMAAYGVDRARAIIEQAHGELRSRGQRLPRLPVAVEGEPLGAPDSDADPEATAAARADAADAVRACALLDELLLGFGHAYERLKSGRRAVDFDDLELLTRELLAERESVRSAWSERFELLMVDEFQDTNPRQLGILAALDRGNLFTVGDELQSIYGFRHADVSLFRARRAELEEIGGSLRLTRNFRARQALLDVVNAVFAERFADYTPLLAGASQADPAAVEPEVELLLTSVRGWEEREELAAAVAAGLPHAQIWRQAEARLLAQRVAELVRDGHARAGEVVVLLRAAGDLEVFERALQLRGLRTLAAVGTFWGHQQIGDLISYLRALANPLDEVALYGALASPLAGCSKDCLALLADAARTDRRGVWETALAAVDDAEGFAEGFAEGARELAGRLAPADRDALASFCARLRDERAGISRRGISVLIERAIKASGYREHVLGLDWAERRLANVHKLLRLARRFEASEGRDLRAFLDHVEYLQDAVKVEPDAPVASSPQGGGVEPDAVRLMTIHAAKGLEFPVVCLADLGRQPNTQTPDLLVDGDRLGLRLVRLDGARSSPALDYERLCQERREREAEEEDRILYVAMTRARERLLLSGAVDFERWPTSRQAPTAISWLVPALAADLPALAKAGDAVVAVHDLPIAGAGAGAGVGAGVGAGSVSVRCRLNAPSTVGAVLRLDGEQAPSGGAVAGEEARSGEAVAGDQLSIFAECAPSSIQGGHNVDTIAITVRDDEQPGRRPAPASALSYTSLSELERCGYRYYLERVLGLPEDRAAAARGASERRGLEARARGTLIHRLMELFDFTRPQQISHEDVAETARELGMRVGEEERAEIARLITAASAAEPAARVAVARNVRREHPFAFSLDSDGPLITGVIDLLASEADGGCLVLDYKSDRVGPQADLQALVADEYGIQRLLYALAVLREGAAKVEIVHWFLERPGEWVGASHTARERGALEQQLAEHVAHARESAFNVSPRPHRGLCLTCPGRAGLCSWGDEETLREGFTPLVR
ncbi:MAG TPA: UvrD-helicase domain-containing protein [Solirubrobacteraceae bacterium]|jgi:ATP-dependent helicase/nuclease subunit A|nr:UvrD-helicase domain-containing protein [Solirubrobacteraceae bacterium]